MFKNSRKQPLLTQWARPARHEGYTAEHDDLYFCREDGLVQLVEIKPLSEKSPVEIIYNIGPLNGSIDTAFAILDTGKPGGDDLVVACGDMSDVGVYSIKARKPPMALQALQNWAPMLDFVVIDGAGRSLHKNSNVTSSTRDRQERNRVFTISGRGDENGSINEMRYGLEARIAFETENEDNISLVHLWALPDPQGRVLFLLASLPWGSHLMHISSDATDLDYGYDEEDTGLDFQNQTLAAGCTQEGIFVQITEVSLRSTLMVENGPRFAGNSLPDGAKLTVAGVRGESSLFAAIVRKGTEESLYCGRVLLEDNDIKCQLAPPLALPKSITCLSIEVLGNAAYVVLGSADATIQFVSVDGVGLKLALEQIINLDFTDTENCAIAAVAIIRSSERITLLCGLRSGNLLHFDVIMETDSEGESISKTHLCIVLGSTTLTGISAAPNWLLETRGDICQHRER